MLRSVVIPVWASQLFACGLLLDVDSAGRDAMDASSPMDATFDVTVQTDSGRRDAGPGDAANADTGPDASRPDASGTDAGFIDAGMCEVSPCRLVAPQCGCALGEACYWSAGVGCQPEGSSATDAPCIRNNQCLAGLGCITGYGESAGVCRPYCLDDATCEPEARCIRLGARGGVAGSCESLCDPLDGTGCAGGLSCILTNTPVEPTGDPTVVTGCAIPGVLPVGSSCGVVGITEQCAPGTACDGAAHVCRRLCDAAGGPPCAGGNPCRSVGLNRGGRVYGICAG